MTASPSLTTSSSPLPYLAIFDHDGVLVDSLSFHQEAWRELGRRTGLPLTPEFIHATFGMTNPMIFRKLLGDAITDEEIARYGAIKEECYRDAARGKITLMDGVRPLLDALTARGVLLAIGSSGVRANLDLTVESCGLVGRFATISSLEDISRGKPDPEVFLVAARKAGVEPVRAVVFEDAPVGVEAARAAGMLAVGVACTHPTERLAEAGADQVVANLIDFDVDELIERLQERSRR
jgi:HAD superfamily hydrolase (TIGR01509 family)